METCTHAAFRRKNGSGTLVICVHGIQGSPHQFERLAERLPEHVDYECVLLPGHGTAVCEFRQCGAAQWTEYIQEICAAAEREYERVIYVGHSMGCLLGILAADAGIDFDGMLLLACPLVLRPTAGYFIRNFRAALNKPTEDPFVQAVRRANSVHADSPWQYLTCIRPYADLLRLIKRAKLKLRRLKPPLVLLHSENDEIVHRRSLELFDDMENAHTAILPESGHFLYGTQAEARIFQCLAEMIDGQDCAKMK